MFYFHLHNFRHITHQGTSHDTLGHACDQIYDRNDRRETFVVIVGKENSRVFFSLFMFYDHPEHLWE